jgi:uncharacterized membrane protein
MRGGALVLIAALGCVEPSDTAEPDSTSDSGMAEDTGFACGSAPSVTWENWGRGFVTTHCQGCHASTAPDRYGATEGVHFDTVSDIRLWTDRIRIRVLEEEDMPPAGGLSADERFLLEVFLDCGL